MTPIEIRRHIHKNPELGNSEFGTSSLIIKELESLGIPTQEVTETGVMGIIDIGAEKTILLRADMDALPIREQTELEFASDNDSVMHACGHDIHTAMLLGAAQKLVTMKEKLKYNIKFVFQPDEEGDGGAKRMIDSGVLENPKVNLALAFHVWPDLAVGSIGLKSGGLTATCDEFEIVFSGSGGHIAESSTSPNPIIAMAEFINRKDEIKLDSPFLIGFANAAAGNGRNNIIPQIATLSGSFRVTTPSDREDIQKQIRELADSIAKKHKLKAEFIPKIFGAFPPVVNDAEVINKVRTLAQNHTRVVELEDPYFIAEDFGCFAEHGIPSALVLLGCSPADLIGTNKLHTSTFVADESVLDIGIDLFVDFVAN